MKSSRLGRVVLGSAVLGSLEDQDAGLQGAAAGTATALGHLSGAVPLVAAATGASSGVAILTTSAGVVDLAGTADGVSSGAGVLTSGDVLAGVATGSSSGLATLSLAVALHGVADGVAAGVADLSGSVPLRATATGRASGLGHMPVAHTLSGLATGSSSGHGDLWWGSYELPGGAGGIGLTGLPVLIVYGAQDITQDVIPATARFTSAANGATGSCVFRVRDDGHTHSFEVGSPLRLAVQGKTVWAGYATTVRRGFFTTGSPTGPADRERYFEISGVDLNVLFQRRVLYGKNDPTATEFTTFAAGTSDQTIVKAYMSNHLDLSGDALTDHMIESVGVPSTDVEFAGHPGWTWGDLMAGVTRNTGALYYIDPDRNVVLTDVDIPSFDVVLTDRPASSTPFGSDSFDRVIPDGWGTGAMGAWTITGAGDWSVAGGSGVVENFGDPGFVDSTGYAELSDLEIDTSAYELTGEFMIERLISGTGAVLSLLLYREDAGPAIDEDYSFRCRFVTTTGGALNVFLGTAGNFPGGATVAATRTGWDGIAFRFRWQLTASAMRLRVWKTVDAEPGTWLLDQSHSETDVVTRLVAAATSFNTPGNHRLSLSSLSPVSGIDGATAEISDIGVRDVEISYDGGDLRNDVMIWGAGQGSAVPVFKRVQDAASITDHGRWQVGMLNQAVWRQATVDRIANSHVYGSPQSKRGGKDDAVAVRCTTFDPRFRVGHKVTFRSEVFDYADVLPIRAMEVDFPTAFNPRFNLTLSHEIDAPWNTYEFWMPTWNWNLPPLPPLGGIDIDLDGIDVDIGGPGGLPPQNPCNEIVLCCVTDTFTRTASTWGTTDTGDTWSQSGSSPGGTNGSVGLLHNSPAFTYLPTSGNPQSSSGIASITGIDCASLPVDFSFDMYFTGMWRSEYEWSDYDPINEPGGPIYAPGFDVLGVQSGPTNSDAYYRQYIDIRMKSGTIPHHEFGIYNSESGGLWLAATNTGTVADVQDRPALQIGTALEANEVLHVRMRADSDRTYLRAWRDGDTEPSYWMIQTNPVGTTWTEEILIRSVAQSKGGHASPAFAMHIDNVCVGSVQTVGEVMGLFGSGSICEDDFEDRDESDGWGGGWIHQEAIDNQPLNTLSVNGGFAISEASFVTGLGAFYNYIPAQLAVPIEILARLVFRLNWDSDDLEYAIGLDGAPTPAESSHWAYWFIEFERNGPFDFHSWAPVVWMQTDFGGTRIPLDGSESPRNLSKSAPEDVYQEWDLWVRVRIEEHASFMKVWEHGFTEPVDWDDEAEDLDFDLPGPFLFWGTQTYPDGDGIAASSVKMAEISVVEGCTPSSGNPCGTEDEPDPDPIPGYQCHGVTRIETPEGEDELASHFRFGSQWVAGTQRVWLDGELLRPGVDYTYDESAGWIAIDGSINVGGTDSFNPSKPVWMCAVAIPHRTVTFTDKDVFF